MPVDEQGTPTRGTGRKAIEDERVDSPTPPKSPRALLALEDSSRRNLEMIEDETAQSAWPPAVAAGIGALAESAWPTAVADGNEAPIFSPNAERRFDTVMELRAEVAKQESKAIACERARQESLQHVGKMAFDEIEALQERIMRSDHQIRQQEAVIQGQRLTAHEMSIEDEGATYRCADLERINVMAQEVAAHLKERVIGVNEEYNGQGFNAEEMYREAHARGTFNINIERQGTLKDFYNQESTQQNVVLDLQRKLLNEECSMHKMQKIMYERRNEVHDMQLNIAGPMQLNLQSRTKRDTRWFPTSRFLGTRLKRPIPSWRQKYTV